MAKPSTMMLVRVLMLNTACNDLGIKLILPVRYNAYELNQISKFISAITYQRNTTPGYTGCAQNMQV